MKGIKYFLTASLACALLIVSPSCDYDHPDRYDPNTPGGSMLGEGNFGNLDSNMVAMGGTRAVSYMQGILLGTVDFSKLNDIHSFGIVCMESVPRTENHIYFYKETFIGILS